ncbi:MAG TPA: mechanosensitive ion channel domain-containing protein [Candidatus Peribacterales bacterium]|nr:mechanosensitive ion channel domain-containing protein [Candidatus Peribacterales bacterium]
MFSTMQQRLREAFSTMLAGTWEQFIAIVPQIFLTIVVLVVGAVVAHLAYKLVLKCSDMIGLDKLAGKVNIDRALRLVGIRSTLSKILGLLVYWLAIFFVLLLLSEILDLGTASDAIGAIVVYIPHLIIGLLLVVIGLLIGRFLRDVVSTALARAGVTGSAVLGHVTQAIIVLFACLLALRQIGFDVSIIMTNIAVILAVVLASTGLAIALGLRPVLEQSFSTRQLKKLLKAGDHVEIGDLRGTVHAISFTHVILRNGNEDLIVPARDFSEKPFTKRAGA